MARYIHPDVKDNGLRELTDNGAKCTLVSQLVSTVSDANTYALGYRTVTPGLGTSWAIGNRPGSGRRATLVELAGVGITASGTATHLAIIDTAGAGRVLWCEPLASPQAFDISGGSVTTTIPAQTFDAGADIVSVTDQASLDVAVAAASAGDLIQLGAGIYDAGTIT